MDNQTSNSISSKILSKFKLHREIGRGSYGVVWAATHIESGTDVAIKKIGAKNFTEVILAKRALRELKLLRYLNGHDNIACFYDVDVNDVQNFNELYIVEGLMEADLHQIIRSKQQLTDQHFQYFIYQLLRGLKYIHSANILHRDLKPGNLLINSDCELRICDFGLARGAVDGHSALVNTEYVATRYYRAPEVILSPKHYSKAIDLWSVGCIFGELLGGKTMFKGQHYVDQIKKIFEILGTPKDPSLMTLCSPRVLKFIQSWPKYDKVPLKKLFPHANQLGLDLMEKLLEFDPTKRITAEEALKHPYLAHYHHEEDEPSYSKTFDFGFELTDNVEELKKLIAVEVQDHKQKRQAFQMKFSTPTATNIPDKPHLDSSQAKSIPRYVSEAVIGGPTCVEDELEMGLQELKIQ